MKNFFLLFFCLLCGHCLLAQQIKLDGYIINLSGDTLRGRILVQETYTHVEFEQSNTKGFKPYGTESIKLFSITDSKTYAPQEIPDDSVTRPVFGEMLVWANPMTLFKFGDAFFVKKESKVYLLDKKVTQYDNANDITDNGSDVHVITNKRYIGILNYLMLDCTIPKKYIDGAKLEDASLVRVVEMYNRCVNPNAEAKKIKRKASNEIGFRAGGTSTTVKVFYPYQLGYGLDFDPGYTLYVGSYANILFTRHFSLAPEVNYIRRKSSAPYGTTTVTYDLSLIQIAIPVRYNLYLPKNTVLSLYGGAGILFVLSNKSGIDNTSPKYELDVSKTELSVFGGAQTMFKVSENCSLGLDFRYELAYRHTVNIKTFNMYSMFLGPILKINLKK